MPTMMRLCCRTRAALSTGARSGSGSADIISAQRRGVVGRSLHLIGGAAEFPLDRGSSGAIVPAAARFSAQLHNTGEEQQIKASQEKLKGPTCHKTFMLELLSKIQEFEATIPDSKQDPPWCGDGDRFFVDNQDALARALAKAHTAWDVISGIPHRTFTGSLEGMAFAIDVMKEDELFGEIMSKDDYQLLFRALFPGLSVKMVVRMSSTRGGWPDCFTKILDARDFRSLHFTIPY